jgi:hypothetical protein
VALYWLLLHCAGINVPIIPGIMPIQDYNGFKRMTGFCKTYVPKEILDELEPIKVCPVCFVCMLAVLLVCVLSFCVGGCRCCTEPLLMRGCSVWVAVARVVFSSAYSQPQFFTLRRTTTRA